MCFSIPPHANRNTGWWRSGDRLRRTAEGLRLTRRKITLDQNTLLSKNLNVDL